MSLIHDAILQLQRERGAKLDRMMAELRSLEEARASESLVDKIEALKRIRQALQEWRKPSKEPPSVNQRRNELANIVESMIAFAESATAEEAGKVPTGRGAPPNSALRQGPAGEES